MERALFRLYVAGRSPRSERAITNLRRLGEEVLAGAYELDVIDVLERPDLAEAGRILTTPTLVKETPAPIRRIIGDLGDSDRLLQALALQPT